MADGKWIRGLSAEMKLDEAARHVLAVRLDVVREHLPRATAESEKDPEQVHQLRVGTRRADAALRIFRPCLPHKAYRRVRARLRTIRRAAGAARDWDVLLIAVQQRAAAAPSAQLPGLDFLAGYAIGQRIDAQTDLSAIEQDQPEPFAAFAHGTLAAVRPPHEDGRLGELARSTLGELLARLAEAADGDVKDYSHLHQVRIAGKRLRYAMEVFADCFGPAFRERHYPMVEEMQETLGRANDSHVAGQRLAALRERLKGWPATWARTRDGIEALLSFHKRRLPAERRRFLRWREKWRQSGVEAVLAEPAMK